MLTTIDILDTLEFIRRSRTPRDWLGIPSLLLHLIWLGLKWLVTVEYDRRLLARYVEVEAQREAAATARLAERASKLRDLSPKERIDFVNREQLGEAYDKNGDLLRWGTPPQERRTSDTLDRLDSPTDRLDRVNRGRWWRGFYDQHTDPLRW